MARKRQSKAKRERAARRNDSMVGAVSGFPLTPTATGFPLKMVMKHRYVCDIVVTASAGATATYQFSCNGLYDPDITSTGSQPLYFDQMTAIYNHYTVFKSEANYRLVASSSGNIPALVAVYVDDDTSTTSSVQNSAEQSSGKSMVLPSNTYRQQILRLAWDGKKYFGGNLMDNDNLQGSASANPVEQSYFTIKHRAADGLGTITLYGQVEIIYTAVWDELKPIATS